MPPAIRSRRKRRRCPSESQVGDLSLDERRAAAARPVRLEAGAGEAPPAGLPGGVPEGETFAFIKGTPKLLGTPYKFAQHGQSGAWVSELLPHFTKIVDDVAIVRSMNTDQFNHAPAELFLYTGNMRAGSASHGLVGDLRARLGESGSAGLRRAAQRRHRSDGRQGVLGQRASCRASIRACSAAPRASRSFTPTIPPGMSRETRRRSARCAARR